MSQPGGFKSDHLMPPFQSHWFWIPLFHTNLCVPGSLGKRGWQEAKVGEVMGTLRMGRGTEEGPRTLSPLLGIVT